MTFPDDDRELVRACLEAAPGAWEAFVGRFARLLDHVVRSTCSQQRRQASAVQCEDIVAEIFLEILRNDSAVLRGFAGRSSLAAYLAVIARRVIVRKLHRIPLVPASRGMETGGSTGATFTDPAAAASRKEEVEGLLSLLDDSEALLVRLHHIEARSYGEISRLTGLPLGSIGPALSKAREKLRRAGA